MKVCPVCRNRFPPGSSFCAFDGQRLEDLGVQEEHHDEYLGRVLDGRYRVESRLGRGGMGVVYAARHVIIDKPVAIKVLRKEYSSDPHQVERFLREARAASRIGHPNIVDVTDFGKLENGQIFFVMEYLMGVTLSRELRIQGALPAFRAINLTIQICHALAAAHAKGIVHRDLKPENIFIVNPSTQNNQEKDTGHRQDLIKLLDFGIAKITWDHTGRRLTKVGSIFGTPQYMSPEQSAGKDADHRGDVYAMGCILYEMLTGEVPFNADTFMGTLTKQMFEKPVPPRQLRPDLQILAPIETVILCALEKSADDRYQSMEELVEAIEACRSECPEGRVGTASSPENPSFPQVVIPGDGASPTMMEDKEQTLQLAGQGEAPSFVAGGPGNAAAGPGDAAADPRVAPGVPPTAAPAIDGTASWARPAGVNTQTGGQRGQGSEARASGSAAGDPEQEGPGTEDSQIFFQEDFLTEIPPGANRGKLIAAGATVVLLLSAVGVWAVTQDSSRNTRRSPAGQGPPPAESPKPPASAATPPAGAGGSKLPDVRPGPLATAATNHGGANPKSPKPTGSGSAAVAQNETPAPANVALQLTSFPPKAKVRVDNQEIGMTPLLISVPVGTERSYVFSKPGYHDAVRKITATREMTFSLDLTPKTKSKSRGGGSRRKTKSSNTPESLPDKTPYGSKKDLRNPFGR